MARINSKWFVTSTTHNIVEFRFVLGFMKNDLQMRVFIYIVGCGWFGHYNVASPCTICFTISHQISRPHALTKAIRKLPWSSSEASFRDRKCTMSEMQETGHSINLNLLSLFHARACTHSLTLSLSLSLSVSCGDTDHKTQQNGVDGSCCWVHKYATRLYVSISRRDKSQQKTTSNERHTTTEKEEKKVNGGFPCLFVAADLLSSLLSLLVLPNTSLLLYKTPPQNALERVPGTPPPTTTAHADSCSSLSSP